ncbi:unnamed protein product [Symbiodinium sp. CCMP2592]|nr:unnamed protein product [Symbiodinium sp. CCMP2592]
MNYLEKQNPMATPTKVKADETCESNDPDRFLGLSPETAELWKTLGDTPDSKALKEEYLRTKGQLHRGFTADPINLCSGFSSGSCGGSTTSETTQVLPGANMQYAKAVEEESRKRPPQDDALDVGLSKRMKQEQAALEKYMNEQMSKLRGQMQQELVQHQQALDEARKQHEAALQAEQERQEQLMMQRQAEHEATLQEEREQHEHNLCLLIEQASSAQAEAVRSMQTAPKPAKADTAPKPDANRADAHDAKAKLRAKMEAHTPGPQSAQPALQAPNPSQAIAVATTPQAAPAAQLALAVPVAKQLPPPAQTQLAVQPAGPPQGIGSGPFNSSTHPNAWGALYRITRAPDCLAEIKQAWDAGVLCCEGVCVCRGGGRGVNFRVHDMCVHTHTHVYIHTCTHIQTYIHTYYTYTHTQKHTYIVNMHTYILYLALGFYFVAIPRGIALEVKSQSKIQI